MLVKGSIFVADSEQKDVIEDDGSARSRENESSSEVVRGNEDRRGRRKKVEQYRGYLPEDPGLWPEKLTSKEKVKIV